VDAYRLKRKDLGPEDGAGLLNSGDDRNKEKIKERNASSGKHRDLSSLTKKRGDLHPRVFSEVARKKRR